MRIRGYPPFSLILGLRQHRKVPGFVIFVSYILGPDDLVYPDNAAPEAPHLPFGSSNEFSKYQGTIQNIRYIPQIQEILFAEIYDYSLHDRSGNLSFSFNGLCNIS